MQQFVSNWTNLLTDARDLSCLWIAGGMQAWHRIIIYIDEIVICTQVIMKKYHLQNGIYKKF